MTSDTLKEYVSINGGIDMWLFRLADNLVEHGTSGFLQVLEAEISSTQDPDEKANLYQVSMGLKNLDRTALEKAVVATEEPFKRMYALQVQFQRCYDDLNASKLQWHAAAESANLELTVWGKWAYAKEIACKKELLFFGAQYLGIRESLKFSCGSSVFDSPESFESNIKHFRNVVDAIRATIVDGYRAANLAEALDRPAFDKAVDALEKLLEQHKALLLKEEVVRQKLIPLEAGFASAKQSIVALLNQMPEVAKWALFRHNRPDLQGRAALKGGQRNRNSFANAKSSEKLNGGFVM
jgi:hypothetical protein